MMAQVYASRNSPVRKQIIGVLGFLEWAQLHPYDVKTLCPDLPGLQEVFISPDVHSLHLIWTYVGEPHEVYHEIADFPNCPIGDEWGNEDLREFLARELGDDSWDIILGQTVFEVISDYRDLTRENVTILSLKDFYPPTGIWVLK